MHLLQAGVDITVIALRKRLLKVVRGREWCPDAFAAIRARGRC